MMTGEFPAQRASNAEKYIPFDHVIILKLTSEFIPLMMSNTIPIPIYLRQFQIWQRK